MEKDKILKDGRFYVPDEILDLLFSTKTILKYKYVNISLGRLRRLQNDRIQALDETINYRFLVDDKSYFNEYNAYCQNDENIIDNPDRSVDTYNKLIKRFDKENYDPKKGVIIINQFYIVEDGLHRSSILLSKFGSEHKIPVLMIYRKTSRKLLFKVPIFELRRFFMGSKSYFNR